MILTWTDDRIERLKKLWEAGHSAGEIAAELGGISRNAAIGKIHRLGLIRNKKKPAKPPAPRARKVYGLALARRGTNFKAPPIVQSNAALAVAHQTDDAFVEPEPVDDDNVAPMSRRLSIQDLNESTCRWPIGDPQNADFHFCGNYPLQYLPYCAGHCRIAYESSSQRRARRTTWR